jgi:hypothetical protein
MEYPDLPRTGRLALRLEAAGIDLASVTDLRMPAPRWTAQCPPHGLLLPSLSLRAA